MVVADRGESVGRGLRMTEARMRRRQRRPGEQGCKALMTKVAPTGRHGHDIVGREPTTLSCPYGSLSVAGDPRGFAAHGRVHEPDQVKAPAESQLDACEWSTPEPCPARNATTRDSFFWVRALVHFGHSGT